MGLRSGGQQGRAKINAKIRTAMVASRQLADEISVSAAKIENGFIAAQRIQNPLYAGLQTLAR